MFYILLVSKLYGQLKRLYTSLANKYVNRSTITTRIEKSSKKCLY